MLKRQYFPYWVIKLLINPNFTFQYLTEISLIDAFKTCYMSVHHILSHSSFSSLIWTWSLTVMLLLVYIIASFNSTSVIMIKHWQRGSTGTGPQQYVPAVLWYQNWKLSHCVHYLICGFEFDCISVFQMTFSCHGIILTKSMKCHCETIFWDVYRTEKIKYRCTTDVR